MKEQFDILVNVVKKLEQAEITYMISGSTAMNYYAQPRMTRDIDIVVELNCNNINILKELFESDFYLDEEIIQKQVEMQGFFNIIHYQTAVKIDFVVKKDSLFRIEEFNRRQRIQIDDNVFAWFVTPEDLILSKLIWAKDSHSEFQLRDISNLLNSKIKIDHAYLRKWANELNVIELLKEVKSYD